MLVGSVFVEEARHSACAKQLLIRLCRDALHHLDRRLCGPLVKNSYLHPQNPITLCLLTERKLLGVVAIGPRPWPYRVTRETHGSLGCTHPGCSAKRHLHHDVAAAGGEGYALHRQGIAIDRFGVGCVMPQRPTVGRQT